MASSSPSRYLLDTNILIHYARADALAQWIEARYSLRKAPILPVTSPEADTFQGVETVRASLSLPPGKTVTLRIAQ